jgi:hypothetical protein
VRAPTVNATYLPEKTAALMRWADHLLAVATG